MTPSRNARSTRVSPQGAKEHSGRPFALIERLAVALLLFSLAGCASQGTSQNSSEPQDDNRSRAKVHTELGATYYLRGQYAVALQELHEAVQSDANYAPAYNVLGLVHGELREDSQADANFRRALAIQANFSEAHNNYGLFLCLRKRVPEARGHFEQALSDPLYGSPEKALSNAGACSLDAGDLTAAESYFKRAHLRAPRHASALLGLAEIDYRQGRLLAARARLLKLAEMGGLDAQALWLGVRIERQFGNQDALGNYAAQLRQRYPSAMQTQWMLLGQYEQMGSLL